MGMNPTAILVMLSLTFLLGGVLLQQEVSDIDRKYSLYNETDFFSSVTSGFKKFVARECWIQADVYLHQGLRHALDDDESGEDAVLEELEEQYGSEENDHHGEVQHSLLVPYNREDFATIRHETAFDEKEILPWLRLTAYMDPHLTKAFSNGGHWLAWRLDKPEEAIEFLNEGLQKNRGAPDILIELGIIYCDIHGRLGTRDVRKALNCLNSAFRTEVDPLDRMEILTYRAECYRILGDYRKAVANLSEKLALMMRHGMDDSERFKYTKKLSQELYTKALESGAAPSN